MATHKISVTVGADSIQVVPHSLSMTSADEAYWEGTNARKFSVEFENDGPFGQRQLSHDLATGKQKPQVQGLFKYSVISAENPKLVLDPVIIVGDPPTEKP